MGCSFSPRTRVGRGGLGDRRRSRTRWNCAAPVICVTEMPDIRATRSNSAAREPVQWARIGPQCAAGASVDLGHRGLSSAARRTVSACAPRPRSLLRRRRRSGSVPRRTVGTRTACSRSSRLSVGRSCSMAGRRSPTRRQERVRTVGSPVIAFSSPFEREFETTTATAIPHVYWDGEGRNRTGDTTIFSQLRAGL